MNYADVLNNARQCIGQYCKACPVCNGVACKNQIPGPGAKGVGDTAIRNYNKWAEIRVNMDTLCENGTPDTHVELFGQSFKYPFFAGPVGAVSLHYSDAYTDMTYNDVLVRACAENGITAFTGDGTNPDVMTMATKAIGAAGGCGVPTIKPWNIDTVKAKMEQAKASGCFAVAMDVDAAGLPFLKNMTPPAGSKSVAELAEIVKPYPGCRLHVDATQAVGKTDLWLDGVDTMSFTAHKFYGPNGIGALYKRRGLVIEPQISGGASTTIYRSGTPTLGLAVSLDAALTKALDEQDARTAHVQKLRDRLLAELQKYSLVRINSPAQAVPHILNVSVTGVKGTRFQQALSEQGVCVSVKSACSSDGMPSKAVFAVSRDRRNALSSWRISLSHLTTKEEIDGFLQAFDTCYKSLTNKEN